MVLPLIPIILIAGTAASLAIQGISEATRPQVVISQPKQKSFFDFDFGNFDFRIAIIAVIIIILLVVLR